jgi:hypothetical protein
MNGAVITPDSVARWWVSLQRGLSHHRSSPCRRLALLRRTDTFAGTKREDHDGCSARPHVSHFETLTHLMLRRSPSARGGVMGRRSQ